MSSSYEWMELQTLTAEIEVSRSRLGSARAKRDHGHIRALQEEIATAERRRDKLLHYISINLAGVPEDARPPEGMKGAELREALAVAAAAAAPDAAADAVAAAQRAKSADETVPVAIDEAVSAEVETERPSREAVDQLIETRVAVLGSTPQIGNTVGGSAAWHQLTPSNIEDAKHVLSMRRSKTLARHAEELKVLEVDEAELETLEQAITAFAQKFSRPSNDGQTAD
jgi:hypothetical protein